MPTPLWFGRKTTAGKSRDPEALAPSRRLSVPPELPPQTSTVTTREKVLETIRAHRKGSSQASDSTSSLPKFDDLTPYDVSDAEEDKLWQYEVERLMLAVEDLSEELEFKTYDSFLEPDTQAAYERLSMLADMILVNLHICRHDNEVLLLQFAEKNSDMGSRTTSEWILNHRLDDLQSQRDGAKKARDLKANIISYFALIDYITAVAARFAVMGADNDPWQRRALSGLAKYAAKLKILIRDTETYASWSIESSKRFTTEKNVMRAFGMSQVGVEANMAQRVPQGGYGVGLMGDFEQDFVPLQRDRDRSEHAKELEALIKKKDTSGDAYFSEMAFIFRWASATLLFLVQDLKASSLSGFPVDAFDICSVVYRGGTGDSPLSIYVHQNRDGEFRGSSYLNFIKHAYIGFALVKQAVRKIQKATSGSQSIHQKSFTEKGIMGGTHVTMQLNDGSEAGEEEATQSPRTNLTTLAQVISVMIPLLCTSPSIVGELQSSLRRLGELYSIDVEEKLTPRSPDFTGAVSLRTTAFESASNSSFRDADFRSLSLSLVARPDRNVSHPKVPTSTTVWNNTPIDQIKQRIDEVRQRRERLTQQGQEWDIEEKSVRVKCAQYVYTVLACATILVVGGLAAGFSLGQRISGVDPFGICTFAWVLAGFIILVAKSVRVNDWPWRDFLFGRVTCRSLSELRAVTGANEQDLILYLLTKESESVLITRGPYNRMFTRKSDSGFSIDIKAEVRTLISAGLIFVKVSMVDGSALVCLDLRRGSEKLEVRRMIRHIQLVEVNDKICRYPPRVGDKSQDIELTQANTIFRWRKILGIYHSAERKIR